MKHLIYLFAAIAILAAPKAEARQTGSRHLHAKAYVRLGMGYAFAHAGMTDFDGQPANATSSVSSAGGPLNIQYSTKKYSFGTGLNGAIAAGLMFHRNIGIELGVTGILAAKRYTYNHVNETSAARQEYSFIAHNNGSVALVPALVFNLPGAKLDLYSRLGLVIPLGGQILVDEEIISRIGSGPVSTTAYQWKYNNYFSLGMSGAVGIKYHISHRIGLWVEANGIARNTFIRMRQFTSYTINGADQLPSTTFNDRVTEYDFDYSQTSATPNPNVSAKALTFPAAHSNIGFAIGAAISL